MDFIQFEAIDESQQNEINFSDDDDDEKTEQDENFIYDSEQTMEDVSFYRTLILKILTTIINFQIKQEI